ncbi:MAG: hypothetical protein RKH07_06660 [Gammaproteobacteria bacterium]
MADFKNSILELSENTEFASNVDSLVDVSQMEFNDVDTSFLKEVIAMEKQNPGRQGARVAYIADSNLNYGMLRMYESLADNIAKTSKVFRTVSEGEAWIMESKSNKNPPQSNNT